MHQRATKEPVKDFLKGGVKWLATATVLSAPRSYAKKVITYAISSKNGMLVFCNDQSETQVLDLISQIKKETQLLLSDLEVCQIHATVKKTEKIPGAIAEVGVYKGGSAKIIREVTRKPLYLFETFEGLPDLSESHDPNEFQKGKYSATFEGVKNYLKDYSDVYLYKGFFPSTADPIKDKMFSFVHLDVDIYESTSNCLKFFYPRMSKGRIILSHDYPSSKGVKKAFDEFFEDKPEIVIDLPVCGQCLVVKL